MLLSMYKWLLFLIPVFLVAYEGYEQDVEPIKPWFTGPILASSGNIVPVGHINIEPYFTATARTSFYNNDWESVSIDTLWNLNFYTPIWIGLTEWMDFKIAPSWSWNERNGQSNWTLDDFGAQLDVQIHKDPLPHTSWWPAMKVFIRENFPTGKYQNLDPNEFGTDGTGTGTYATYVGLMASKVWWLYDTHFLNLYFNAIYGFGTDLDVNGFNAYGGGIGTHGTINPGQLFLGIFSFEYSLSRHWVIACDLQGIYASSITFRGHSGMIPGSDSDIAPMGVPSANELQAAIQYSLAPSIEYNWSETLGLLAGSWFTFAGKNSSHFTSGVLALNYYY